jgi:hypothetical protein
LTPEAARSIPTAISLAEWMSHLPPELVESHLHISQERIRSIPRQKQVIVPG